MEQFHRGERRHQAQRLKAKRKHYYDGIEEGAVRALGRAVHTPKPCSCYICAKAHGTKATELSFVQLSRTEL